MTRSEMLLAEIRREAIMGPDAGSRLASISLKMADEYEIAIKQNLALEKIVHVETKEG